MQLIGDFHIHSRHSKAASKEMNIVNLTKWGMLKGLNIIGTGDFTDPKWLTELEEKLEPAEKGLFRLKPEFEQEILLEVPLSCRNPIRFVLSTEIRTVYKKNGKTRKIHHLIICPKFEYLKKINNELEKIIDLDCKELLKIVLSVSPDCLLIPTDIWNPHFGIFASKSGFDSLEEVFEELTPYIYALETGLTSDPAMNLKIPEIRKLALISNSNADRPKKLGREANIFNCKLDYYEICDAIRNNDLKKFVSTIEFFPEEGKYYFDGHRNCNVGLSPAESKTNNYICPVCGKKVSIGILHRIEELSFKNTKLKNAQSRPFQSSIPLSEIIAEIENKGINTKKVDEIYKKMLKTFGNEFFILLELGTKEIEKEFGFMLAEAIKKVRLGQIQINPGFDGQCGSVKIFSEKEKESFAGKQSSFLE